MNNKNYKEFKNRLKNADKDDVIYMYYEMNLIFNKFEEFMKLKYGDDYCDGWLYFLRTGNLKDEELS